MVAVAIISALRLTGMDRDQAATPIILAAIAVFYPVFAAENGTLEDVLLHGAIAGAFIAVAILGYRKSRAIVAVGLIAHGLFDFGMGFVKSNPVPPFWPIFCLVVDVMLGAWLLHTARRFDAVP